MRISGDFNAVTDDSTGLPMAPPPPDDTGVSSGVFYRGNELRVAYETLNAAEAGYVDPKSTADQTNGLQNFANAVSAATGGTGAGYLPAARNADGAYNVTGNLNIGPSGAGGQVYGCHIYGDDPGTSLYGWGTDVRIGGTVIRRTNDTGANPETAALVTVQNDCKVSSLVLQGPNVYSSNAYGTRPAALAGLQLLNGSTGSHIRTAGFGAGVLIGGPGLSADHVNLDHYAFDQNGFGIFLAGGVNTGGDHRFSHCQLDSARLALIGIASSIWLSALSMTHSNLIGAPFAIMRWDDGGTYGGLLAQRSSFDCNSENTGHSQIYDELWNTSHGGALAGCRFGPGFLDVPQNQTQCWTFNCTETAWNGGTKTITIQDPVGGAVFRPGMVVMGGHIPANTVVTSVSGNWPKTAGQTYTLTLNNAPTGADATVTVAMPTLGNVVCGAMVGCRWDARFDSSWNKPIFTIRGPYGVVMDNTFAGGGDLLTQARAGGICNNAIGNAMQGNVWGENISTGVKLTSISINDTCAQNDLIEASYIGNSYLSAQRATGRGLPIGVAAKAQGTVGNTIDVLMSYGVATVNNKTSGTINSGSLLKPDSGHAGGVAAASSWNDGPIVGRANDSIGAGSSGSAQLWCR